ncbi:flagellar hook-length control protein FliK [Methylophaga sp.]|uniref:flagellar hook-length control protein FliK n=1 Tax=Methylophaga sp. TaxID=2024840 RepID=UPI003F697BFC
MPQHVFIQTDAPVASGSVKKSAAAHDKSSAEAFSSELDKVSQAERKASSRASESSRREQQAEKAAATKPEENSVNDGNKLPPEKSAEKTSKSTQADDQDSVASDDPKTSETAEETAQSSDASVNEHVQHAGASSSSEKPIRAQVEVSQNAVDNAKAAPVDMTTKGKSETSTSPDTASQKSGAKLAEQVIAADKPAKTELKQTSTQAEKAIPVLPAKVDKLLFEENTTAKTGQPNLAAVFEAKDKSDGKPISIRADILDALQRKNGDKEISMTLRNAIAAQLQEQSDKPDITKALLTADRGDNQAKALASGQAFSTVSAASATTSGTISTAASAQGLSLPVQPNMQNPAWSQVMSSRVVWMAKEGVHQAELKMTPANLGPVEVRLQIQNDQASVTFLAQHSATRDALEQALPRLRESFSEAGIELGHAEVAEQQQQQQQDSETEHADDSHIFTQASASSDDIESEQEIEQPLSEATSGLSIYA